MALGGTYQDHYKDMFKDLLLLEAQQSGSRLEQAVMIEKMEGNKTYLDKLGKFSSYTKSSRNEDKTFSDATFERRQVQEELNSVDHIIDVEDLIKYIQNPNNEIVRGFVNALGRKKDGILIDAIGGNAVVTTNGSTANQALTLSVAVNNHSFDSGSGDVGLTPGKLKLAKTLIEENYGMDGARRLICVAPIRQIMNLTQESEIISRDFRDRAPLEGPGVVEGISGYLGIDFIAYEDTGVDGSSDEKVFLMTDDAIRMGIFKDLTVEIDRNVQKVGNPDMISAFEAVGATRMYEEKVVEILCDPLA